jgi:hypothetical protein
MSSYLGPAQLILPGHVHDVQVNLHEFVDLTATAQARWRGVVMDASFVPTDATEVRVRIPGHGEAPAALAERRLVGDGHAPFQVR